MIAAAVVVIAVPLIVGLAVLARIGAGHHNTVSAGKAASQAPPQTQAQAAPSQASAPQEPSAASQNPSQSSEGVTPAYLSGYVIERSCAHRDYGGNGFYYSSANPTDFFCVHPAGSSPVPVPGGGAQIPPTCAIAPDQTIYCIETGNLTVADLEQPYKQGYLPTRRR
jgi:hypothetical protein